MLLAVLASCTRDHQGSTPVVPGDDTGRFDYATSQQVNVSVDYPVAQSTYVELYTRNPLVVDEYKNYTKDETLEPVAQGYTDASGHLALTLRLPTMYTQLYAYSPTAAAPVLLGTTLHGTEAKLTGTDRLEPGTRTGSRAIAETSVYWKNWKNQTFTLPAVPGWSWDAAGKPAYLCESKLDLDAHTLQVIDNTIPAGENLDLSFSQLERIDISEDAHVRLYFVSHGSARKNALAYYTYTGNTPTQAEINRTAVVLFPNLSSEALATGDGAELKYFDGTTWSDIFPAGSKIGFVLLVDAWEQGKVAATGKAMYSQKNCNRYDIPSQHIQLADRPHMATFNAGGHFILSFEDLPYNEAPSSPYRGDFRDDIFVLTADPVTALPDINEGIQDPDQPRGLEIPSKGVLAFEDLWPYKGDYDLNDIVVAYRSTAYLDARMNLDGVVTEWTFRNNGGQYVNGFGVAYDFPASAVKAVKIEATNGVEVPGIEEQAGDSFQMLFFNDATTVPSGTVFTVTVKFHPDVLDITGLHQATAPFNPFITVRTKGDDYAAIPRKEVHLTNYRPTPLALTFDEPYGDDLSDPKRGLYYTAATGYPFAIDLAGIDEFVFPGEMQRISEAYPRFTTWVETQGKEAKDWYVK